MKLLVLLFALVSLSVFGEEEPTPSLNPGPPALEAKAKNLLTLLGDLENPKGRSAFLAAFPKDNKSFTELCISEYTLPVSDCHEIILNGLGRTAKEKDSVKETAKVLAKLASEIGFDADAPNYVQETLTNLCVASPQEFSGAVKALSAKAQNKALKFMNESFLDKNREDYVKCLQVLKTSGDKKTAEQGAKFVRKNAK